MMPKYLNKRGEMVFLGVTNHAKERFIQRWHQAFPGRPLPNADEMICKLFSATNRVTNLSYKEKARLDKHGKDTMFFRTQMFTFIVQNATIVTIEISGQDMRYLNKEKVMA